MAAEGCQRCGTVPPPGARFCNGCGVRLVPLQRAAATDRGGSSALDPGIALVECETCGAGNAASRPLCARCGTPLRDEVPGGDALPEHATAPSPPLVTRTAGGEGPSLLLGLVLLAGLITAGVLLALVTSRVTAPTQSPLPTGASVRAASASSSLDGHPPSAAIDGDPATAWTEAAPGVGEGEWVEMLLAEEAAVRRVIIWNGDQRDEVRFNDNGRAAAVRIEVGDRQFRVALLDIAGPQAIDLPVIVTTDRVRIVVEDAIAGASYTDLAISEIVIETS
ncbi:MAG TPA: discoidin domain-containing protein [Euzebya sp.]|nr:discoidin domain-containing protein [Euzebya sp.]